MLLLFVALFSFQAAPAAHSVTVAVPIIIGQNKKSPDSLHIEASDNGTKAEVLGVTDARQTPRRILLLLDLSESTIPNRIRLQNAYRAVLNSLPDFTRDKVCVATTGSGLRVAVPFTSDPKQLASVVPSSSAQPSSLRESLLQAVDLTQREARQSAALADVIVFTDVAQSSPSEVSITESVEHSGVRLSWIFADPSVQDWLSIYRAGIRAVENSSDLVRKHADAALLAQLVRQTGGLSASNDPRDEFALKVDALTAALRRTYFLHMRVAETANPTSRHSLQLSATKGWTITYRSIAFLDDKPH